MAEKILVVDDDPETVRIMQLFLQRLGYTTLGATAGPEAIDIARKENPDLIILDVMMPGMDGYQVARSLHRLPETSMIPVLMVTARSAAEDKTKGYESGADIYLTKPVHQMDLAANIKALLLQRQARKAALNGRGYVVGVIAAKGGLGVSTVALNLAAAYQKAYNVKTIAAELRPGQGTWADELNLPAGQTLGSLLQLEPEKITPSLIESQLASTTFGVRLLLASNFSAEPTFQNSPAQYEAILSGLCGLASLIVLDIGTYFSTTVHAILRACSEVIVITEPQPLAVMQTARLVEYLRKLEFGASKPFTLVSINRTSASNTLTASEIENQLRRAITLGIPPAVELASVAIKNNRPMFLMPPEGLVHQQYRKLAEITKTHADSV